MQRITKRNEDGGISLDALELALQKLAEYEDTGLMPSEIEEHIGKVADVADAEGYRRGFEEAKKLYQTESALDDATGENKDGLTDN